ncbi:hypothetical protein [Acinetobacter sp. Ver3]|uniref:hypothetical protein n=1 Tax=Acinetobacter sp. Ver3 TaxID=466088 RepID=UPI0004519CBD|nr:hypothetical protein [Acinetobacter sp. Ver3]EZQ10727.1 hypothetical protein CL42_06210 [Acinetobacter sp. Ver3]
MATTKIELTRTPKKIASAHTPTYIQSSREFRFAFSATQPNNLNTFHTDMKIYTDGDLGDMWAWVADPDSYGYVVVSTA